MSPISGQNEAEFHAGTIKLPIALQISACLKTQPIKWMGRTNQFTLPTQLTYSKRIYGSGTQAPESAIECW